MTLDGSAAASDGSSRWITSDEARHDVHLMRAEVDAVVVGVGTMRADNPRLDVRIPQYDGHQPTPVIVAGRMELPAKAVIWEREPLVISDRPRVIPSGEVLLVEGSDGLPDPTASCKALADRGLLHLLLEGGPALAGAWWRSGVVSHGVVYVGAKIGGGAGIAPLGGVFASIQDSRIVTIVGMRTLGGDLRVEFELEN
jgi:diaminohydroxyphosphoribosylaminopyrimidine deaminase/5-amino-6-(5-phosphoribosylamino)uracil reductase